MATLGDLIKADFAALTELHETVKYQVNDAAGAQPWKTITQAIVKRGDPQEELELGTRQVGPVAAEVMISKDPTLGIASVNVGRDKIRLDPDTSKERVYTVRATIDPDDPGVWDLYAGP